MENEEQQRSAGMGLGLSGAARRHLRGLAHHLNPLVSVGKAGLSDTLVAATAEALADHELIKVRFVDHKSERRQIGAALADRVGGELITVVGHVAVLFKPQDDPERSKIVLPE
ncbi:MAG: RNA-binding protein [Hyphomicrobiaceae bacterium]|jgi:RNA-binding protein